MRDYLDLISCNRSQKYHHMKVMRLTICKKVLIALSSSGPLLTYSLKNIVNLVLKHLNDSYLTVSTLDVKCTLKTKHLVQIMVMDVVTFDRKIMLLFFYKHRYMIVFDTGYKVLMCHILLYLKTKYLQGDKVDKGQCIQPKSTEVL